MRSVLITGGAGFIGTNLANHYLNKGDRVVVFDNFSRRGCVDNLEWLRKNRHAVNLHVVDGDIRHLPETFHNEIRAADALFHLAAQVAVTTSVTDPLRDFEINAQGTLNLLELVRNSQGKQPIVFYASTNKVYGGMEDVQIVEGQESYTYRDLPEGVAEERRLDFHSPYGCSKGCADQYVKDYARIYQLKTVVFRQSCIYGDRQFGTEDQGWVAWFVLGAVLGKSVTIFGNGKQVRDVLFIDDLVNAFDLAWDNIEHVSGQVYNIGGGSTNAISLRRLLHFLRAKVNPDLGARYAPLRRGDQPVYISNIAKARQDMGWRPKVHWCDGVMRMVEWVKNNKTMFSNF
jgi:CDP-paratose 2-epimerase